MPRLHPLVLALSLLCLARPVAAGGSAVFEAGDGEERGQVSLEFDGDRLRMTPQGGQQAGGSGYVVFRDGRMYSVATNDGETVVFETSQMMKMMGGVMAQQMAIDTGLDDIAAYHGLNATGRSETHAGITGEVYTVDYTTRAGKREKTELVLAKNATLVEMSTAMTAFSEMMAKAMGQPQDSTPGAKALTEEFQRRKLGVLRVEDSFRLTKLDTATPKAARFTLPAEPMVMPDMSALPAGLFGAGAAGAAGVDADGNPVAEVVDDKVERQKQRVQQRAEQEADQATDQVVDKALNKAFDKLFGR